MRFWALASVRRNFDPWCFSVAGILLGGLLLAPLSAAHAGCRWVGVWHKFKVCDDPPVRRERRPPREEGGRRRERPSRPKPLSPAQIRALRANKLAREAFRLNQEGEFERALDLSRQAYQLDPQNSIIKQNLAAALHNMGNEYYKKRNFLAAKRYYQEAHNLNPDDPTFRQGLRSVEKALEIEAKQEALNRKFRTTERKIQDILEQVSKETGAPAAGGLEFARPGDRLFSKGTKYSAPVDLRARENLPQGDALRSYIQRARWPVKAKAAFVIGILQAERGRYDQAVKLLKQAYETKPGDAFIAQALDDVMRRQRGREEGPDAGGLFDTGTDPSRLSSYPSYVRAKFLLASADVSIGDHDSAIRRLREAEQVFPGDPLIENALRRARRFREREKAPATLPERIRAARSLAQGNAAWSLGLYLLEHGDRSGARGYFSQARKAFPEGMEADLLRRLEEKADTLPGGPIEGFPVYPSKAHAVLDALEYGKGSWAKSLLYLETAYRADPENLAVRDALNYLQGVAAAAQ